MYQINVVERKLREAGKGNGNAEVNCTVPENTENLTIVKTQYHFQEKLLDLKKKKTHFKKHFQNQLKLKYKSELYSSAGFSYFDTKICIVSGSNISFRSS